MKSLFYLIGLTLSLVSCTILSSRNVPGTKSEEFPQFMRGKYELVFPEGYRGFMENDGEKNTIVIGAKELTIHSKSGASTIILNDSLYLSKVKKQYFLSLGETPSITVYKVVQKGSDLELHGINAKSDVTLDQLKPYFKNIEIITEMDDNGEPSESYVVTLDDKKLEKYYKSKLILVEPFTLKKID